MNINPDMLAHAYEYMRSSVPFNDGNYSVLPHADEVEFRVVKDRALYGWHKRQPAHNNIISVSENCVGQTYTLLWVIAHEMIHLYQAEAKTYSKANHNAEFKYISKLVCEEHGFDLRVFV